MGDLRIVRDSCLGAGLLYIIINLRSKDITRMTVKCVFLKDMSSGWFDESDVARDALVSQGEGAECTCPC